MSKINRVKNYLKEKINSRKKFLIWFFAVLLFVMICIVSVAGSLRIFLPYFSDLTGFPFGHKKYLLVFQNNNELRPSGGFISSFATIDFQSGFPVAISFEDVYGEIDDHTRQTAPYPMEELLANKWYKGYTFRDANFFPEFRQSAQELLRLYKLTRPSVKFDGVIAVNFSALEDILAAIGPLKVEGEFLDNQNLFQKITASVNDVDRHNLDSLAQRKSILKPLASEIFKKILFNPFKLRKISDTVTSSLARKDIQLYFPQSSGLAKLAEKYRYDGSWPSEIPSDFLAVNEANLGGMKSDRYLHRNITYRLKFTEAALQNREKPKAELKVELLHFGIENIPLSGPYTGYFRFYNSLSETPIADQIIKLNPGETKEIIKNYEIPNSVLNKNNYSLYLSKQSGTNDFYTVIIEFPRGYQVKSEEFESHENFAVYRNFLTRDIKLDLELLPDTTAPSIILQENKVLNRFDIHFNEDMNQDFLSDPFSYEIRDANIKNPNSTDQLKIIDLKTTSKDIEIFTSGQSQQPEERYLVRLKNLRDSHGNILSDREITLIQRLE